MYSCGRLLGALTYELARLTSGSDSPLVDSKERFHDMDVYLICKFPIKGRR